MCSFCKDCFKLPCVSKLWRACFTDVITANLSDLKALSNKILPCFIEEKGPLDLGLNYRIFDSSLKRMTNLTDLDLQLNSRISYRSLKHLTNLRKLCLRKSRKDCNKAIPFLQQLEDLDLDRNKFIVTLPILTNLTKLQLNGYVVSQRLPFRLIFRNRVVKDEVLSQLVSVSQLSLQGILSFFLALSLSLCISWLIF
jgi:hypothetical protein